MAEVRVTAAGGYVELSPEEATRVTKLGGYVELSPQEATRMTTVGSYVELDPINAVRITQLGAYVELLCPPMLGGTLAISGLSAHSAIHRLKKGASE